MKIITAIGNEVIYNKFKKIKEFELYKNDILYREGILEILNEEKNFDLIIIYEKLPGEISFEKLIEKIKIINNELKIVFILENKNEKIEKLINKKNIFYNDEINLNNFIFKIKNINNSENNYLKIENEKLKKIIIEKNKEIEILKNNFNNKKSNNDNLKLKKILIITNINFNKFKKIKNILKNEKNKIEYLELNNINRRIKNYNNLIFLINLNLGEIKENLNFINYAKEKYLIEDKKINIIFIQNKENICNLKILKHIFKDFIILGKINYEKNEFKINKKIIEKINNLNEGKDFYGIKLNK